MAHINVKSTRQRQIDRIRMVLKRYIFSLSNRCARCCETFDLAHLDLDEIRGRHSGDALLSSVDPLNMQLLCRKCHTIKTDEGRIDYLNMNQQFVKMKLFKTAGEMAKRLPTLYGSMQYRLEDVENVVKEVCK